MRWDKDAQFVVTEYSFSSPKIKKDTTIAVIADLHNCFYGDGNCRLLKSLKCMEPDMVVIAGDLIESAPGADSSASMNFLSELSELWPVYYGVGNHERKLFIKKNLRRQRDVFVRGLQRCGVKMMHNSVRDFEDTGIRIIGLDIPHEYYRRFIPKYISTYDLEKLTGPLNSSYYNVMIAHDPDQFGAYAGYGVDLVLSGHIHGGIIRIPGVGGLLSPKYTLLPAFDSGIYRSGATSMAVSRGLGSHTFNIRINNVPELLKISLLHGENYN